MREWALRILIAVLSSYSMSLGMERLAVAPARELAEERRAAVLPLAEAYGLLLQRMAVELTQCQDETRC